jgi:hypothetical protein
MQKFVILEKYLAIGAFFMILIAIVSLETEEPSYLVGSFAAWVLGFALIWIINR